MGTAGAIEGARTLDTLDHNQMLYQLSYDRHKQACLLTDLGGGRQVLYEE